MNVKLSERLKLIASFIPDNVYLIDVGCDHALLDIYLVQTKKSIKVIASDINEKPLQGAAENIKKYGLLDKIELIQSDGLKQISDKVDTIVISGMGGILISEILDKKYLGNIKNIILAPNNEFPTVRKTLYKNGFSLEQEILIREKNITYLVIKALKGKKKIKDYFFGILDNKNQETINYYTKIFDTNLKILKQLPKKYFLKRKKIKQENKKIKKFLNK